MSIQEKVRSLIPHRMLANIAIRGIEIYSGSKAVLFNDVPGVLLDRAYNRGTGQTRKLADMLDASIASNTPPFDDFSTLLVLIAAKTSEMREVQRQYFAKRSQETLDHAKVLEKELDGLLAELAQYSEVRQEALFG